MEHDEERQGQIMKKRIVNFILCFVILFTNIIPLQAAEGVSDTVQARENKKEERDIPKNPKRPKRAQDEWKGDYVYFGRYYTYYGSWEAIKWRVLKNDGKNLLLMADSGLDYLPYHDYSKWEEFQYTWEDSTIREYLNSEFIQKAFTKEEQECLQVNHVRNGYSSTDHIDSGRDTEDKVYLLSMAELKKEAYGFYGSTGAAKSRRFSHEDDYYE